MKLVKWSGNWADEFDTYGFIVCTDEQLAKLMVAIHSISNTEIGFGTNESWVFDDPEDLLRDMKIEEITDAEVETLKKLFPSYYEYFAVDYGLHPFGHYEDDLRERIHGWDEEEDLDERFLVK